jgi:hypothetical protein
MMPIPQTRFDVRMIFRRNVDEYVKKGFLRSLHAESDKSGLCAYGDSQSIPQEGQAKNEVSPTTADLSNDELKWLSTNWPKPCLVVHPLEYTGQ